MLRLQVRPHLTEALQRSTRQSARLQPNRDGMLKLQLVQHCPTTTYDIRSNDPGMQGAHQTVGATVYRLEPLQWQEFDCREQAIVNRASLT